MPFVNIPQLKGKVYAPSIRPHTPQKHNCRTCFSCQMCSDDRCTLCRLQTDNCATKTQNMPISIEKDK